MNNMSLFDYEESVRLRDIGIEIASSYPNDEWVAKAKSTAFMHAAKYGEVSADDIHQYIADNKLGQMPNKGAMGAVFRDKHLKFIRYEPSKRKERHTNRNGVYEYFSCYDEGMK